MTIYFHSPEGPWGGFSNFAAFGFELDGVYWATAEHCFQACKFEGTEHAERIRKVRTPREAASIGRDCSRELRPDWDEARVEIMRRVVLKKFETHAELRKLLLSTGDEELIEAPGDPFWGAGRNGNGENMLGRILMDVREILRGRERS